MSSRDIIKDIVQKQIEKQNEIIQKGANLSKKWNDKAEHKQRKEIFNLVIRKDDSVVDKLKFSHLEEIEDKDQYYFKDHQNNVFILKKQVALAIKEYARGGDALLALKKHLNDKYLKIMLKVKNSPYPDVEAQNYAEKAFKLLFERSKPAKALLDRELASFGLNDANVEREHAKLINQNKDPKLKLKAIELYYKSKGKLRQDNHSQNNQAGIVGLFSIVDVAKKIEELKKQSSDGNLVKIARNINKNEGQDAPRVIDVDAS